MLESTKATSELPNNCKRLHRDLVKVSDLNFSRDYCISSLMVNIEQDHINSNGENLTCVDGYSMSQDLFESTSLHNCVYNVTRMLYLSQGSQFSEHYRHETAFINVFVVYLHFRILKVWDLTREHGWSPRNRVNVRWPISGPLSCMELYLINNTDK